MQASPAPYQGVGAKRDGKALFTIPGEAARMRRFLLALVLLAVLFGRHTRR